MQELLLAILFIGALFFLANKFRNQYVKKDSCGVNCGCETTVKPKH